MGYLARRVETSGRERIEKRSMGPGDFRPRAEEPDVPTDSASSRVPAEELEDPLECVYSWIECAHDKRSWAEVQEEEKLALSCTPVRARVAEAGHQEERKEILSCAPDAPNRKGTWTLRPVTQSLAGYLTCEDPRTKRR